MQTSHHIIGSESLVARRLAPGYGALHRGVGLRRRHGPPWSTLSGVGLLALAGLSFLGLLAGPPL